jgi:hypothetical protein
MTGRRPSRGRPGCPGPFAIRHPATRPAVVATRGTSPWSNPVVPRTRSGHAPAHTRARGRRAGLVGVAGGWHRWRGSAPFGRVLMERSVWAVRVVKSVRGAVPQRQDGGPGRGSSPIWSRRWGSTATWPGWSTGSPTRGTPSSDGPDAVGALRAAEGVADRAVRCGRVRPARSCSSSRTSTRWPPRCEPAASRCSASRPAVPGAIAPCISPTRTDSWSSSRRRSAGAFASCGRHRLPVARRLL